MQKLFDAALGFPVALFAANEEFPRAPARYPGSHAASSGAAWSAYEIWRSRIRLLPGEIARFLSRR
jgi:hypothetical protein